MTYTLRCMQHMCRLSLHGNAMAVGCATGNVHIWDLRSAALMATLKEHDSAVTAVSLQGDSLVTGDLDGSVYLWRPGGDAGAAGCGAGSPVAAGAGVSTGTGSNGAYDSIKRTGSSCQMGCTGGSANLWLQGSDAVLTGKQHQGEWIRSVAVHENLVLSCTKDGSIHLSCAVDQAQPLDHLLAGLSLGGKGGGVGGGGGTKALKGAVSGLTNLSDSDSDEDVPSWGGHRVGSGGAASTSGKYGSWRSLTHSSGGATGSVPGARAGAGGGARGRAHLKGLRMVQSWSVVDDAATGGSAGSPAAHAEHHGDGSPAGIGGGGAAAGAGAGAGAGVVNQAYAVCADQWGFAAGCQDCSIRLYYFTPNGTVPEV